MCRSRCVAVQVCVMRRIHTAHPQASAVVWHCSAQLQLPRCDGSRAAQGPCSQDQEKAPKDVGSGSSTGPWPLSSLWMCCVWCMFRIHGSYSIISVWNSEVSKIWRSFPTQENHHSYSWFWSLIHVLMCWCPCPGVNVALKSLVGWLVFLSVFLYLYGHIKKKIVSKIRIWLWLHSSCSSYTVFSCAPRPHALKLMESNQGFGSRLGQGYYLYSEKLGYAKSWVSYPECHYFFLEEPGHSYRCRKPFLRNWQGVRNPSSIKELHWRMFLGKSQVLEQSAVPSVGCSAVCGSSSWQLQIRGVSGALRCAASATVW